MKTVAEIEEKIKNSTAVVMTASEFKEHIRNGEKLTPDDVDVVTCATCGVMSGIYAVLSMPFENFGRFDRCTKLSLNGIKCTPGPSPNERNMRIDAIVNSAEEGEDGYNAGKLFRDIVEGKDIEVKAVLGGEEKEDLIFSEDIDFKRLYASRCAQKNCKCYVNPADEPAETIFSVRKLAGGLKSAAVCGCGEINPLENDPEMRYLKEGAPILFNGAKGRITGTGTASKPEWPNISAYAEMTDMMPEFMGGFNTSCSADSVNTIAAAIPILDEKSIKDLSVTDDKIPLPILDVNTKEKLGISNYAAVWGAGPKKVEINPMNCLFCGECPAGIKCPTGAVMPGGGIIQSRCISCGTCLKTCPGEVYSMEMPAITLDGNEIPVSMINSSRAKAEEMCEILKEMILNQEFSII